MPFAATQMQLEILTLSKLSQKEKDNNDIIYLCNLKYGTDDPVYKTETDHSHGEQTCGCQGKEGGSGMDEEFGVGRCKLSHLEGMGSGVLLYSTGTVCDWVTLLYSRN